MIKLAGVFAAGVWSPGNLRDGLSGATGSFIKLMKNISNTAVKAIIAGEHGKGFAIMAGGTNLSKIYKGVSTWRK